MDFYKNIGISFKGDFITQGTYEEKCKLSKKLGLKNIELVIMRSDDFDIKKAMSSYDKNLIINLPLISYNLSNLKDVERVLLQMLAYNVDLVFIKAFNLNLSEYEFSTDEEKREKVEVMARGIATLASNKITVALENHTNKKEDGYFGQDASHMFDLMVYSRKVLMEEYGFNEKDASKYVRLCLNVDNVINNTYMNELDKWIELFKTNISAIKISHKDNYEKLLNTIFDKCIENNIDCPILIGEKVDLEELEDKIKEINLVVDNYVKSKNLDMVKSEVKVPKTKKKTKTVKTTKKTNESGFTNIIVVSMIVLTVVIAALMIYIKTRS